MFELFITVGLFIGAVLLVVGGFVYAWRFVAPSPSFFTWDFGKLQRDGRLPPKIFERVKKS